LAEAVSQYTVTGTDAVLSMILLESIENRPDPAPRLVGACPVRGRQSLLTTMAQP